MATRDNFQAISGDCNKIEFFNRLKILSRVPGGLTLCFKGKSVGHYTIIRLWLTFLWLIKDGSVADPEGLQNDRRRAV